MWSQIRNISTIKNTIKELKQFTKKNLESVKTGWNDSKFTIGKYHINTMKILKLFRVVNIFMPVAKLFRHVVS